MKLNKFIFKHFAPIPSKQWKQKIQYDLNGADYQTQLVKTDIDGISTLPYYTHSDCEDLIDYSYIIKTSKAVPIIVSEATQANDIALKAIKKGAQAIYLTIYTKEINVQKLLTNIHVPIFVSCHFLNVAYAEELQNYYEGESLTILTDPIGKLATTGNWYRDTISDFEKLQQIITKNGNSLSINMSLFHNAGASTVQQLAYSISQVVAYSKQFSIHTCTGINYQVAVGTDFYTEIAKLKVLRSLHEGLNMHLKANLKCTIIVTKNKRNIQALNTNLNSVYAESEHLIGFSGNADVVVGIPENVFFFNEEKIDWEVQTNTFLKADIHSQSLIFKDNVYIEKLIQQLVLKTSELIENMEQGGGFLVQFKKGILQQKIEQKALIEQKAYKKQFNTFIKSELLTGKTPNTYPFFKFENKKRQYKPIIEKRLAAPLEKPIWDNKLPRNKAQ